MNKSVPQLIQQSDLGWIFSLSDGVPLQAGEKGASSVRLFGTAEASAEPQRGRLVDGPAHSSSPAIAEGAFCKVVFDGELYNRAELRDRLAASSSPNANNADLVLHAYLRWGEDVVHKVNGIFALLIWDARQNMLFCARDPLGQYPLFYADAGRELLFSTSIEALIRHPHVPDTVNRAALADHLLARWPKLEETYFEAVNRVPPGHAMKVRDTGRQQYRYWDPIPVNAPIHDPRVNITEDELERFDELLDQAVDRCLHLGRAAIYLSGGLDSVSIAAVATHSTRLKGLPDPVALSLVFPGETSEEPIQRGVAQGLGLTHELMPLYEAAGSQGLLQSTMEISSTAQTPLLSPWSSAYYNLGLEGKRHGCQVILTGQGGDEWLVASPLYAADMLRAMDFRALYRFYKMQKRSWGITQRLAMRNVLWKFGALPLLIKAGRGTLRRRAPGITRKLVRWNISRRRMTPDWIAPDPALARELLERQEQRWWSTPEPPGTFYRHIEKESLDTTPSAMMMEEHFEFGRRLGTPLRFPYWDVDLVEFLRRTPPELLNRGGFSKAMVRQTLGRRFPNLGFERQKKRNAFDLYRNVEMNEGAHLWRTVGGAQALAELGVVETQALNSHISMLLSGAHPRYTYRIREVLMVEAWLRPRLRMPLSFSSESNGRHQN